MENSVDYLKTLQAFYDACLTHGAVRVTRQANDLFTMYTDEKKFFLFPKAMAVKVKKICWLFPNTAKKNLDKVSKALSLEFDGYLCCTEIIRGGRGFAIRLIDSSGKIKYKAKCKYFTINMFRIKKKKKVKVNKANKSMPKPEEIQGA